MAIKTFSALTVRVDYGYEYLNLSITVWKEYYILWCDKCREPNKWTLVAYIFKEVNQLYKLALYAQSFHLTRSEMVIFW